MGILQFVEPFSDVREFFQDSKPSIDPVLHLEDDILSLAHDPIFHRYKFRVDPEFELPAEIVEFSIYTPIQVQPEEVQLLINHRSYCR
jgi:hypothetical protein